MNERRPLCALPSHALVAFTIEADNAFELAMPHRTARDAGTGPWLTSMVMWWNCLRFVGDDGIGARDLVALARTKTNFDGMRRWGYVTIDARNIVGPTARGKAARDAWPAFIAEVEGRWNERFGASEIGEVRAALRALIDAFGVRLPDCMPILAVNLRCDARGATRAAEGDLADAPLPVLLAKVLLAFAIAFEREADVSLAISADVLAHIADEPARVRDLPRAAGISKEAVAMALGSLERGGYASTATHERTRIVTLTGKGRDARRAYPRIARAIEDDWSARFGNVEIARVRDAFERTFGTAEGQARLLHGIEPRQGNWRAALGRPAVLPDFPMVLHRGGYPDGS